ncbi:MAG: nicotinate-nucleotide--dimethylbenzimidazole phosphoribosyltransferase, partial [Oceanisphaera sp.]|nr:nicotinate-nucleotide--dimethylbenzimidazole phosphoribosyltransferase [Oceanisphaera sp.]
MTQDPFVPGALIVPVIPELANAELGRQLRRVIDHKTKPLGALGRLETLALQLGLIQGCVHPVITQPQIRVFAADHGLTRHGTSAYPSDVTAQMVHNFLQGGAAINVFARQHGLGLQVVDAGVELPVDCHPLFTISEEVGSGASAILHGDVAEMLTLDNGTT